MSALRSVLGLVPTENFALVYKGDTLASQITDGAVTKNKFFDEHITSVNFEDSLEFRYSLPLKEGTLRLSLPDSVILFSREFRFHDSTEYLVRYDKSGSDMYRETKGKKQKTISRFSDNAKREIKSSQSGWSKHYQHLGLDSSYVAYYSVDSILMSQSISVNFPNEEQLHIYSKMNPYHYSLRRSYNSKDSNYTYNYLIHNGDTSITDNLNHRFRDIDSTYTCYSYSDKTRGLNGFTQKFEKSLSDSSYGYNSAYGGSVGWTLANDTFKISKDYNLNGKLIRRESMLLIDGDYGIEELLDRRDTFYHIINHYHALYWKENHITDYFPYYKQIYLDEDSSVIRELNYSFDIQDEWPILTITEGDSTWVESTADGASSKYALEVGFCGGVVTSGYVSYIPDENTFIFTGIGSESVRKKLLKYSKQHFALDLGVGAPPLYFINIGDAGSPIHNFKAYNEKTFQSLNDILTKSKTTVASLYVNGEQKKIDCTFLKLDFNYSLQVKRVKRS